MTCDLYNEIFIACDYHNAFWWYFDLKWNLEYLFRKTKWWNNRFVFCWPWKCKESWWCLDGSATLLKIKNYIYTYIYSWIQYPWENILLTFHWCCRSMRHTFSTINWYNFRYVEMVRCLFSYEKQRNIWGMVLRRYDNISLFLFLETHLFCIKNITDSYLQTIWELSVVCWDSENHLIEIWRRDKKYSMLDINQKYFQRQ